MKSIIVAVLLVVSVAVTFCLTYAGTQVLGQAPVAQAPSSNNGSYWNKFPVGELPIGTPPPVYNYDGNPPAGVTPKDIAIFVPKDCKYENIISVSNGKTGLVVTYRTESGMVRVLLYPNAQAGDSPSFTFVVMHDPR
jgi:hypothetical protein